MNSHELARKLLSMEDLPVTVRGYEGGVNIITTVTEPKLLALDVYEEWYYGKHEYTDEGMGMDLDAHNLVRAIHVG